MFVPAHGRNLLAHTHFIGLADLHQRVFGMRDARPHVAAYSVKPKKNRRVNMRTVSLHRFSVKNAAVVLVFAEENSTNSSHRRGHDAHDQEEPTLTFIWACWDFLLCQRKEKGNRVTESCCHVLDRSQLC